MTNAGATLTEVSKLVNGDRRFVIVKVHVIGDYPYNKDGYGAIDENDVCDGKLIKEYNLAKLLYSGTIAEVIDRVNDQIYCDKLRETIAD